VPNHTMPHDTDRRDAAMNDTPRTRGEVPTSHSWCGNHNPPDPDQSATTSDDRAPASPRSFSGLAYGETSLTRPNPSAMNSRS